MLLPFKDSTSAAPAAASPSETTAAVSLMTDSLTRFAPLFTIDAKKQTRVWRIEVLVLPDGSAEITTESGVDGGQMTETRVRVSEGKNIGRANETSPREQAETQALSKWTAQVRSGYRENPDDCRAGELGSGICAPMLAQKYSPDGSLKGSKTLEKMKIAGATIAVQPKLDGLRCLARITAETTELFTRKGDRMLPIPHIEWALSETFHGLALEPGQEIILDGELYTNAFTFNTLSGLLRRENKTDEHYAMLEQVSYHVYDKVSEDGWAIRIRDASQFTSDNGPVVLVPYHAIVASDAEIRGWMEAYLDLGYEGLMIRRLDMPYENKRSWGLVKYKDFQDAEYRVVDIVEDARGGGVIGAFVLEAEVNGERVTFNAGIKDLTHEESARMFAAKDEYVGRLATVEFFQLSEYSIPRFPKVKGFRPENDIS